MIYLDNAATSWPKPETVYQAVSDCLRNLGGSPGRGSHTSSKAAGSILFDAREELAKLFGLENPANVIFAYSATDALNIALFGLLKAGDRVVTTSMAHNAVARPLRELKERGVSPDIISCDHEGRLRLDDVKTALDQGARALVVGHGSNVTGTLVSLPELGRLAERAGAVFIVDAAQTAGVEEINMEEMKIGILAFSGHKGLLGPQGTGGLCIREDLVVDPLRFGGTGSLSESDRQPMFYPDRLESGTPNTPGIAGLLAGARFIRETGLAKIREKEKNLTKELMAGLAEIPKVTLYGPALAENRTAVVSFTIEGMDCGEAAFRLDRDFEIACRPGLHCAPWAHHTIGTHDTGTIRFSPGYFNSNADIDAAVSAVRKVADCGGGK